MQSSKTLEEALGHLPLYSTIEELYKWADMYLMFEDNIRVRTQIVMITKVEENKPLGKKSYESKRGQSRDRKRSRDQSQKKR